MRAFDRFCLMFRMNCRMGAIAGALTCLAACSGSVPTGQVIARADGREITSAQLETVLNAIPGSAAANVKPAQLIDNLINETLFMAQAEEAGLDKDPRVAREMDRARRTILAQAYLRQIAPPKPITATDINDYYAANPLLYTQRKIYGVTEIIARGGKELDAFVAPLGNSLSMEGLIAELGRRNIAFSVQSAQFPSDDLAPGMAAQFAKLADGQAYSYRTGVFLHFGRIDQSRAAPLTQQEARDRIIVKIAGQRIETAARNRIAALRQDGKVELGELGKTMMKGEPQADPYRAAPIDRKAQDERRRKAVARGLSGL